MSKCVGKKMKTQYSLEKFCRFGNFLYQRTVRAKKLKLGSKEEIINKK